MYYCTGRQKVCLFLFVGRKKENESDDIGINFICHHVRGIAEMAAAQMEDGADRCRALLDNLYRQACEVIAAHSGALDRLCEALLEREILSGEEATRLLNRALSSERQDSA